MRKFVSIAIGLAAVLLIALIGILRPSAQNFAFKPAFSTEAAAKTDVAIASQPTPVQISTEALPAPRETVQPASISTTVPEMSTFTMSTVIYALGFIETNEWEDDEIVARLSLAKVKDR